MSVAVKRSTIAVKKETTYGIDPTVTSANVIRVESFDFGPDYDMIEVNEIRNTKDKLPALTGKFTATSNIGVLLRGSATAGTAPEGDPLYECAWGAKNTSTASTTTTGSTTTSIVLTAGGGNGFAVGDAIRVANPTPEVTWVTAKSGDTLTVSPALSVAPASGVAVGAGVHYKTSLADLPSFWSVLWRGDVVREDYGGNKVDSFDLDIGTGAICTAKFGFKGVKMAGPVTQSYTLGTPSFNTLDPLVGVNQVIRIGGSVVRVDKIAFGIKNDIYDREDVTSDGISARIHTGRTIEGSFSVLYESADIFNAFKNRTDNEAVIILSNATTLPAGRIVAIRIPKMRYTKAGIGQDNNLFKYDITFAANITAGEDAAYMSWL